MDLVRSAVRAALCAATLLSPTAPAAAQTTLPVPEPSGDQLIFLYDARSGRVPFLNVSNPASVPVPVEVAFYPQDLASRLGSEVRVLPAGGHAIIDPTDAAGGAANGSAGLAVITPVTSDVNVSPVVPPAPLLGSYTLANTNLGSSFGENPMGRLAVNGAGNRAAPGAAVDGQSVSYQRFTPAVLTVPVYFNPNTLEPPENDGNRVILAAFSDSYGGRFELTAASDSPQATFLANDGTPAAMGSVAVNGVLLSNLQAIAGTDLASSGKLFLDVDAGSGNVFGLFSQSLGTFANGGRMPAVDVVPGA